MSALDINSDFIAKFAEMKPFRIKKNVIREFRKTKTQIVGNRKVKSVNPKMQKSLRTQKFRKNSLPAKIEQNSPTSGSLKPDFQYEQICLNQQSIQLEKSQSTQDQSASYHSTEIQQNNSSNSNYQIQQNRSENYQQNNQNNQYNSYNNSNNNNTVNYNTNFQEAQQIDFSSILEDKANPNDFFMQDYNNQEAYSTDKMDAMLDLNVDNDVTKYCNGVPTPDNNQIINYFNYENCDQNNFNNNNTCNNNNYSNFTNNNNMNNQNNNNTQGMYQNFNSYTNLYNNQEAEYITNVLV